MITRKFNHLFDFSKRSKVKAGEGLTKSKYPFYTSSSILKKRLETAQYFKKSLIFGTGGSASIHFSDEPFATSTDCIVAIKKKGIEINEKFVFYYLFGNIHFLEKGFKGAGLKHISKKYIQTLDIPIYPIDIQNKIVALLDKINSLVQKRGETISILDELLRAQFLELFGDLSDPSNKHKKIHLIETCNHKNDVRCGPFGTQLSKSEFKISGVPLWGIKHINSGFAIKTDEFVSKEKANRLHNYSIFPRDILMTRKGSVGNCHIYPKGLEMGIMHSDILRIRVDEDITNPYFLYYQFRLNNYVQWQIQRVSPGVVMAGINVSKLKKVLISMPPIKLQNEFEAFYYKIEAEKELLTNSKIELENLYNVLVQRAFNGQLNLNVDLELDALLAAIDTEKEENDIRDIATVYASRLLERLETQTFENQTQYKKAKHVTFQLLREGNITQKYDKAIKAVKMQLS